MINVHVVKIAVIAASTVPFMWLETPMSPEIWANFSLGKEFLTGNWEILCDYWLFSKHVYYNWSLATNFTSDENSPDSNYEK